MKQIDLNFHAVRMAKSRPSSAWLVLLLSIISVVSASALSLQVGTVRGFPGNTVEVPVTLRYGTNEPRNVVAFQADVLFEAVGLSDGTPVGGPILVRHLLASSVPAAGTRRLLSRAYARPRRPTERPRTSRLLAWAGRIAEMAI